MRKEKELKPEENSDSNTTNHILYLFIQDWLTINNAKFKWHKTKVYFSLKQESNTDVSAQGAVLSAAMQGFRLLPPCGSSLLQVLEVFPVQPKDGGKQM